MNERKKDQTVWLSPIVSEKDFDVRFRDDHIRITIGPHYEVNRRQRLEFWDVIRELSARHGSRRILIEGFEPKGERSTDEVIDAGQRTGSIPSLWIAFCFENFVPTEQSELFEVIAATRGARVKFFSDRQHALKWLRLNAPS